MRGVRFTLMTKSLSGGAVTAVVPSNPAMRSDGGPVMDDGRQWAGDPYDEGMVSDPDSAFAKFASGGEDTEAWLDRNDDGTLVGWVREGADVFRYSDPEAWAQDVDGAQMTRADTAAPVGDEMQDPNADPATDPNADPNADPAAAGDETGPLDADGNPLALDAEGNPVEGPEGFADEADPATENADPTAPLKDPTDLPAEGDPTDPNAPADAEADATEEFDNPFAELDDDPDAADPAAEDPIEDPDHDPDADENARAVNDPDADGDAEGDDDKDGDGEPADEDLDENGKPKKKKGQLFGGKVQVKHLPGQHNQETHGDWAHGPGHHKPKKRSTGSGGSGSADPKGGEPEKAPAPAKASLDTDTVKALDDETLRAISEDDALYDYATMEAACIELDKRDDVDARTRGFAQHTEVGSPERQALFDSVIPDHWSRWVAQGAEGKKPKRSTKRQEIQDAYELFVSAQMLRAEDALAGGSAMSNAGKRAGFREEDFFNGRVTSTQFKKYASEEMQRFFARPEEQRLTFSDFAAEFYPSYAKAKAKVGSRYISEFG